MIEDFCIFILSHGRAGRIDTVKSLKRSGYSGRYFIVIDNEDDQSEEYYRLYGDKVIMFDKSAIAETFDEGDNFQDRRAVVYARNACFEIARGLGITYFMELDDDYTDFRYKMDCNYLSIHRELIININAIIISLLNYYKSIQSKSIAISQGGDFIGGIKNQIDKSITARRKCMNTFICSTDRPFQFVGRVNEDVNTYTWYQSLGNLFITIPLVAIQQRQTQKNKGGMSEMYLDSGTYIKSFYTVMFQPSSVRVGVIRDKHIRLHHQVSWEHTVPCIINEKYRVTE